MFSPYHVDGHEASDPAQRASSAPVETHRFIPNFLSEEHWSTTAAGFGRLVMQAVHSSGFEHVYAFGDGISYHSSDAVIDKPMPNSAIDLGGVLPSLKPFAHSLIESPEVDAYLHDLGGWSSVTIRAYLYPSGSGLTWHTDRKCVAAYVYYTHEAWDPFWGGELLIDSGATVGPKCRTRVDPKLYPAHPGIAASYGTFLLPLPNSLALIRGGIPHCVKKVEPAAGNYPRASVSGFFYRD